MVMDEDDDDEKERLEEYKQWLDVGYQAFERVSRECDSLGLHLGAKALMLEHAVEHGIQVTEDEREFLGFYNWLMQMTTSLGLEPDFLGMQLMPQASENSAMLIDYIDTLEDEHNTINKPPKQ